MTFPLVVCGVGSTTVAHTGGELWYTLTESETHSHIENGERYEP